MPFHIGAIVASLLIQWGLGTDYIVLYPDHRQEQIYEAMNLVIIFFVLEGALVIGTKYFFAHRKKRALKLNKDVEAGPGRSSCSTKPSNMNAIVARTRDLAERLTNPDILRRVIRLERDNLNALYQNEHHQEQQSTADQLGRTELEMQIANQVALVAQLLAIESSAQEAAAEQGAQQTQEAAQSEQAEQTDLAEQTEQAEHEQAERAERRRARRQRQRDELEELYNSCVNCRAAIDHSARTRREIRWWTRASRQNPDTEIIFARN